MTTEKTFYDVTNIEIKTYEQRRYIRYALEVPLPNDWLELSHDARGMWLNENAGFVKDFFDEPEIGEVFRELTVDVKQID